MSPEYVNTLSHEVSSALGTLGVIAPWSPLSTVIAMASAYIVFLGWRWVGQASREHRDFETMRGVQEQLHELRVEVKELRREIDRLKTAASQRQPEE